MTPVYAPPPNRQAETMRSGHRKIIRFLLLLLVASTLFLFVYPMKNGKPLLSLEKIRIPEFPNIPLPDVALPASNESAGVTIYKWQDRDGGWHFSNEHPPQGITFETTRINPEANLINSASGTASGSAEQRKQDSATEEEPFGYSAEKISEMMGATSRVKNALDSHNQAMDQLKPKE